MPIELDDDLKEYASQQIASGAYDSIDALLQAALQEKMDKEQIEEQLLIARND